MLHTKNWLETGAEKAFKNESHLIMMITNLLVTLIGCKQGPFLIR